MRTNRRSSTIEKQAIGMHQPGRPCIPAQRKAGCAISGLRHSRTSRSAAGPWRKVIQLALPEFCPIPKVMSVCSGSPRHQRHHFRDLGEVCRPCACGAREARRSASNASLRFAQLFRGEQVDMEKARPTISSRVRSWRLVTLKPSSCGKGRREQDRLHSGDARHAAGRRYARPCLWP